MPSELTINLESVVGYKNELKRATKDMWLGVNDVNQKTKTVGSNHMAGGLSRMRRPNSHPSNSAAAKRARTPPPPKGCPKNVTACSAGDRNAGSAGALRFTHGSECRADGYRGPGRLLPPALTLIQNVVATARISSQAFLPSNLTASPVARNTKLTMLPSSPGSKDDSFLPMSFKPLPTPFATRAKDSTDTTTPTVAPTGTKTAATVKPYFLKISLTRPRRVLLWSTSFSSSS